METNSIKRNEYVIVNGGKRDLIDSFNYRYYVLFLSGSGYGGQSGSWCSQTSTYEVYKPKNVGSDILVLCGTLNERQTTNNKGLTGEIDGNTIDLPFLVDEVFTKIVKK